MILHDNLRSAVLGASLTDLHERLQLRVPSLIEQRRVVAYLDDLQKQTDALKALQADTSTELDALMPSILDKAFR